MWIAAQLKRLTEVYNVILGVNEAGMARKHGIVTVGIRRFEVDLSLDDCPGIEANECDLSRILRSGRAYCKEFDIEPTMFSSKSVVDVAMDKSVQLSAPTSCSRCFYSRFVSELLSRVKHATLPVKLKIGGRSTDISLLGIGYSGSKDTGRMRACVALQCTIDGVDKLFVVASRDKGSRLCYLELIPRRFQNLSSSYSRYLIDNKTLHSVLKHELEVHLLPTDLLDFSTPENTVESLYGSHRQQFDMNFRLYFSQLANGVSYRERISKRASNTPAKGVSNVSDPGDAPPGYLSGSVFKVVVAVSFAWITVLLVRESQARQALRAKVSIL